MKYGKYIAIAAVAVITALCVMDIKYSNQAKKIFEDEEDPEFDEMDNPEVGDLD